MIPAERIEIFDWQSASVAEFGALNRFNNLTRAEVYPEDGPMEVDEEIAAWRGRPSSWATQLWVAWRGPEIIGTSRAFFRRAEDNQHLAELSVNVLPEYRRYGLARELLARLVAFPQAEGRTSLLAWTTDRVPAGEAFMERIGARRAMLERVSELMLTGLNRERMDEWLARAPERASGFAVELHEGAFADADIEAIVELLHVMNDAPREGLEVEDERLSADDVRGWQRWRAERGIASWTLVARELATGRLAGFTETFWHPNRPEILHQGGTGVWPQYRNKGLGRWLKAAMIERTLRELPQVRRIRTDNASSNAPMLKINYDLGFKPLLTNSAWQVQTAQVLAYLAERGDSKAVPGEAVVDMRP